MKYIDAEKLKTHIQHLIRKDNYEIFDVPELLSFINSLQQEQPSLPSNIDEAAEEYAYTNWQSDDYHEGASEGLPFDAIGHTEKCFKAGAEWMAEQGETQEHFVIGSLIGSSCGLTIVCYTEKFAVGDKVIVQIRKKEE